MMRLPQTFYARDTRVVAKELLGKLVCTPSRVARIVETEAYHGPKDAASHARAGKTARTSIMFGPAGFAYIYLIYGMYCCLNVTTGDDGFPSAVLLRAGEIVGDPDLRAGAGPGKLCRALGLSRAQNGEDLVNGERLFIADDGAARGRIRRGPRVNVDYAGAWAEKPWRFWIDGHPSVSRRG